MRLKWTQLIVVDMFYNILDQIYVVTGRKTSWSFITDSFSTNLGFRMVLTSR